MNNTCELESNKKKIGILVTCVGSAPASAIVKTLDKSLDKTQYELVGIDMMELCEGTFVCDEFRQLPVTINNIEYWHEVEQMIESHNIGFVFVTHPFEAHEWSLRKDKYWTKYNCKILLNDTGTCDIANDKFKTIKFAEENNIRLPSPATISDRPIVIKDSEGVGSRGLQILLTENDHHSPYNPENSIIQKYIDGIEYTVDVLSDPDGHIVNIVPKRRCVVKNGQSFVSKVCNESDIIEFVRDVCTKLQNKSAINVQVMKEKATGKIYLIEINPRFPTSLSLTVEAGVNMPKMLIESDYNTKRVRWDMVMVRGYQEYYQESLTTEKDNVGSIFLTGGAGFIGSNILATLLENTKYNVTVYDNLSTVNCGLDNISDLLKKYPHRSSFVCGDILDKEKLVHFMKGHCMVIHMAAQLEITSAYNNPQYDLNINLIGTINVLEGCRKNNIKRLINASSACVYGATNGTSSKETDPTNPNWEYGITKLAAEKYIQIASATDGLKYTSLRFSIVYGQNEWYGRVLTIFVKRALEGKDLVIFGDGKQTRDYINVLDVASFVLECVTNESTHNKVYNVSSGKATSVLDLAKRVQEHFPTSSIVYDTVKEGEVSRLVEGRERLNQELRHLYLDNTRAKIDTNWSPVIDFDEYLPKYISWAKTNAENWAKGFKV